MPYAADNSVSKHPIEGGIPITDEHYEQAREHSKSGLIKVVGDTMYLASKKPHPKQGESVGFDTSIGEWVVTTDPEEEPTETEKLEQWRASASVSRRQAKQALVLAGMYASVQPSIDAITDETERLLAQIFWDDSNVFERNNSQLIAIAEALGLTPEQIDDLFTQAETL